MFVINREQLVLKCLRCVSRDLPRYASRAALLVSVIGCAGESERRTPTNPIPVPVARIAVTPAITLTIVGFPQQLNATTFDANGNALRDRTILWSTSNAATATVSASGLVSGIADGNVTISAASEGQQASAEVQVLYIHVQSVSVTPETATTIVGGTQQLTALTLSSTGLPLPNRTVTWSSSDPTKATVNASGLVTTLGAGTITISATCEGKTGSASITIVPSATASPRDP